MNEQKVAYIFEALEKSGVRLCDFHRLTQISLNSLHRWRNEGEASDKIRVQIAYVTAQHLESACRAGHLPLVDKLKPAQRFAAVRKIVASQATK